MKISNTNYIQQPYTNPPAAKTEKGRTPSPSIAGDSINLSSTTRDLQKISVASESDAESRAKLVQDLKQKVQANQYTINAEQIAEKMITGFFTNEVA